MPKGWVKPSVSWYSFLSSKLRWSYQRSQPLSSPKEKKYKAFDYFLKLLTFNLGETWAKGLMLSMFTQLRTDPVWMKIHRSNGPNSLTHKSFVMPYGTDTVGVLLLHFGHFDYLIRWTTKTNKAGNMYIVVIIIKYYLDGKFEWDQTWSNIVNKYQTDIVFKQTQHVGRNVVEWCWIRLNTLHPFKAAFI